jgi:hypothetical protein
VEFTLLDAGYTINEGYVRATDGSPIGAKITVIETDKMRIHGVYRSNRMTGKFIFMKCEDHDYQLIVEAEGYFSNTVYRSGEENETLDIELLTNKE